MNAITANACDISFNSLSTYQLRNMKKKDMKHFFMPCESDGDIFKNHNLKKEIDVLFFGQVTPDRNEFVEFH